MAEVSIPKMSLVLKLFRIPIALASTSNDLEAGLNYSVYFLKKSVKLTYLINNFSSDMGQGTPFSLYKEAALSDRPP